MNRSALIALALSSDEERRKFVQKAWDTPITTYFLEAIRRAPHLDGGDVFAYRDYIRQHPPQALYDGHKENNADLVDFDAPKCNLRAAELRREGNKLYAEKNFLGALFKYNESICCARGDSEDLGIGFANRSAVFYEMHEFELALANVQLAKRHNYPLKLMPKLDVREANCREKLDAVANECSNPGPKFVMTVEVNPSIPGVAKGIAMAEYPKLGRGMKAEKDFNVGDVILQERPTMVAIDPRARFEYCHHCASEKISFIPCPHCVSVMYCGEECLEAAWKQYHRFECGIFDKLSIVPFGTFTLGPRLFFYGLTQFNDSVPVMMEYCKAHGPKGNNPFDLDYTKPNPMEVFKLFHTVTAKRLSKAMSNLIRCVAAILCDIYLDHPLVRSLFVEEEQRNFLLKSIDDYMAISTRMVIGLWKYDSVQLFTIASVCNHSCDPNAHAVYRGGELKFIVVRPIRQGEQIFVSYGFVKGEIEEAERFQMMALMDLCCACEVCAPGSDQKKIKRPPQVFYQHLDVVRQILLDNTCTKADKMNAMQQFIQRYAYVHPLEEFQQVLVDYRITLQRMFNCEVFAQMRKQALAGK